MIYKIMVTYYIYTEILDIIYLQIKFTLILISR